MVWEKGQSGNPGGRPKGHMRALNRAMEEAAKEDGAGKGTTFLQHLVNRAFENDTVLIAVARKILPDLKHVDVEGDMGLNAGMSDEQLDGRIAQCLQELGIPIDSISTTQPDSRGEAGAGPAPRGKGKKKKAE